MTIDTSMKDILDPTGGSATIVDAAETVVSRIAAIEGAKGAANGLASLNSSGKLAQTVDGANVNQDSTHRLVTDTEKATWSGKQDAITTGTTAQYLKGDLSLGTFADLANVASGFIGIVYVDTWANCLANKPPASNNGKFYIVTDRYNGALYRSNGTCLDSVGGGPIVSDTASNINANYDPTTYDGCTAFAADLGASGAELLAKNGAWTLKAQSLVYISNNINYAPSTGFIMCNPSGATYTQSGTTVTVTWTSHGIPSTYNGAGIYLAISTGTAASGWYKNITVVDANTITCTSSASLSTSGNIGANTAETLTPPFVTLPSWLIKAGVIVTGQALRIAKVSLSTKSARLYIGGVTTQSQVNVTNQGYIDAPSLGTVRFSSATKWFVSGNNSFSANTLSGTAVQGSMTCTGTNDWQLMVPDYVQIKGA